MARRLPMYRPGVKRIQLSGTALQWIGFVLLCLSSLSIAVLQRGVLGLGAGASLEELAQAMKPGGDAMGWATGAVLCSLAATLALPVYAKLLCEGHAHAQSRRRYLLRLALCALASEIPYDFATNGRLLDGSAQNPAWALLLSALVLEMFQMWKFPSRGGRIAFRVLVSAAALAWALLLRIHMGVLLVLLVLLFYFAAGREWVCMAGGLVLTMIQFPAPFGLLLVHWYDGKPDGRWLFCALYPAQLLVFGLAGMLLAG